MRRWGGGSSSASHPADIPFATSVRAQNQHPPLPIEAHYRAVETDLHRIEVHAA